MKSPGIVRKENFFLHIKHLSTRKLSYRPILKGNKHWLVVLLMRLSFEQKIKNELLCSDCHCGKTII
jgi:hypothetical protein